MKFLSSGWSSIWKKHCAQSAIVKIFDPLIASRQSWITGRELTMGCVRALVALRSRQVLQVLSAFLTRIRALFQPPEFATGSMMSWSRSFLTYSMMMFLCWGFKLLCLTATGGVPFGICILACNPLTVDSLSPLWWKISGNRLSSSISFSHLSFE